MSPDSGAPRTLQRADVTEPGRFDFTSDSWEALGDALQLALRLKTAGLCRIAAWYVKDGTLVLTWKPDGASGLCYPFPAPLTPTALKEIVTAWLEQQDYEKTLGPRPHTDGSVGKGWRVFNEQWGHVFGDHCAVMGIRPAWIVYGK